MSYQQPHCRHHHHFHQYHWGSNALAYIMLWVAGGSCVTATAVTATAATTCDLPYLTYLTYLTLLTLLTYIWDYSYTLVILSSLGVGGRGFTFHVE